MHQVNGTRRALPRRFHATLAALFGVLFMAGSLGTAMAETPDPGLSRETTAAAATGTAAAATGTAATATGTTAAATGTAATTTGTAATATGTAAASTGPASASTGPASVSTGPAAARLPWPMRVPVQIGAQCHDFQNYSNVPYLHGGMDIRVPAGTPVFSPVGGKVAISSYRIDAARSPLHFNYQRQPFDSRTYGDARYVEVAVTDSQSRTWFFRHLDGSAIPSDLTRRAQEGVPVEAGERLGTVVSWNQPVLPSTETYHHLHLEVVSPEGNYLNPAMFLTPHPDSQPPKIHGIWFVPNESEDVFPEEDGQAVVLGEVDVVAGITDQVSGEPYIHSPYRVLTRVLILRGGQTHEILPITEIYRFDQLPIRGDRTQLATVIFKERVRTQGQIQVSCGDGGPRSFLLNLTNGDRRRGYAGRYSLPTRQLPDGNYLFEVIAQDLAGNEATLSREFRVRNGGRSR